MREGDIYRHKELGFTIKIILFTGNPELVKVQFSNGSNYIEKIECIKTDFKRDVRSTPLWKTLNDD